MANRLKMALVEAILTLHRRGWSGRRIARELGVDRATVARYLHQAQPLSNAANAPIGSEHAEGDPDAANAPIGSEHAEGDPNAANAPIGSEEAAGERPDCPVATDSPSGGRLSDCDPWRQVISAKLTLGLTAQRIYQDLVGEHGYSGSY
jgi:transcriptional regulator with XRE-family HTH domain